MRITDEMIRAAREAWYNEGIRQELKNGVFRNRKDAWRKALEAAFAHHTISIPSPPNSEDAGK